MHRDTANQRKSIKAVWRLCDFLLSWQPNLPILLFTPSIILPISPVSCQRQVALSSNHMAAAVRIAVRDQVHWAPSFPAMEINDGHLSPEDGHDVGVFVIFLDTTSQLNEILRNKLDVKKIIMQKYQHVVLQVRNQHWEAAGLKV